MVAGSTSFYRVASSRSGASVTAEGVYLYDPRLRDDSPTTLSPGDAIGALWHGRPIASVRLEPATTFLGAAFEGESLTVTALSDGGSEAGAPKVTLVVETVDGDVFRSKPLALMVDSSAPELAIVEPAPGASVRDRFPLGVRPSDPNGIAVVEWSIDGGSSWTQFEPATATTGSSPATGYSGTISPATGDGPIGILVRATDRAGTSSMALSSVLKDVEAPLFVFESPRPADTVNGRILVSGYVLDGGSIASVAFSPDGLSWEPLETAARGSAPEARAARGADIPAVDTIPRRVAFSRLVDLGALPGSGMAMAFRAIDASGNESLVRPLDPASPAFLVDIEADKPTAPDPDSGRRRGGQGRLHRFGHGLRR